jgi:hypothetical protein
VSQSSSPGVSAVVQGTIREMQAFVTRTLQSVRVAIQHAGPYQQVGDVVQRLNRWVLRTGAPLTGQEPEQAAEAEFGLPPIEVPAWWRLLEQFEGAYEQWAESLPHNWRNLAMPELEAVARTMESTGWVLAWVPREDVLRELIDAQDRRDAIGRLLTHQDDVLDDLKKELGEVTDASLTDPSVALHQGVRSYEWGHAFPAQAIAAIVLTSLITQQLEANDVEASPLLTFRRNSLLRAGGTALNSYWPSPEDPVPSLFNPYATAHRFDLTHFNQTNALAGLMLGVSFLRDLQAATEASY